MDLRPLTPEKLEPRVRAGEVVALDIREPREFGRGHIAGAICVPLTNLAKWAPRVLPAELPIVLVAEADEEDDESEHGPLNGVPQQAQAAQSQITEAGLAARLEGVLAGGYEAWAEAGYATDTLPHLGARSVTETLGPQGRIVDVRKPEEFAAGSLPGAENHPLEDYPALRRALAVERRPVLLVCRLGNRSATAASLLLRDRALNSARLYNLIGGYTAWSNVAAL